MSETRDSTRLLPDSAYDDIERECAKYPPAQRQSGIMAALRIAQGHNDGWLAPEMIKHIADVIGVPPIRAYEVATFYNMFSLKPVGKYKICLCTNLPCALRGSAKVAEAFKEKLGIEFGETTPDGKVTLVEGECFGACDNSPVVIVNNTKMHAKITIDKIDDFLAGLDKD